MGRTHAKFKPVTGTEGVLGECGWFCCFYPTPTHKHTTLPL